MSAAVAVESNAVDVIATLDMRLNVPLQKKLFCAVLEGKHPAAQKLLTENKLLMTEEEIEDQALVLRNLSAENCHFCGEENRHKTGWFFDPNKAWTAMPWDELAGVACSCLDDLRSTRIVLVRGWEKRVAEIHRKVGDKTMAGTRVIYTDKCAVSSCGRQFKVTAQNVFVGMETNGVFRGWKRCAACEASTKKATVAGVVVAKRAPRKNALPPFPPMSAHAQAHGWTLADLAKFQDDQSKAQMLELKKGG